MQENNLKSLLFRFLSDFLGIAVLPLGLTLLSMKWLAYLLRGAEKNTPYDLLALFGFTACVVGLGLLYFGCHGPFQRQTPRLLLRYVARATALTLGLETAAVWLSNLALRLHAYAPSSLTKVQPGTLLFCIWALTLVVFLWFGHYLLAVPDPLPIEEERLLRGLQIEEGEDIEARAFRN